MKTPSPPTLASHAPAVQFRAEIEKAEADGVARDTLLLRLTIGDANKLKRDNSLAVTDISFADGVMWFLGVKTEQGGVAVSALQRPQ
jgi:hypothetical protein